MKKLIFNSYNLPIPSIRHDIQRISIQQNGQSFIYFHDQLNYATSDFALPTDAEPILSLIDGSRSVEDILKFGSDEITRDQILEYIQFLDEHGLLESEYFTEQAELIESEYEASSKHTSTTAGSSYPDDPDEILTFLDNVFSAHPNSKPVKYARALYAPHIDPRVGMAGYVKAFSAIRELKPSRVVILATSHYSGLYSDLYEESPFIISDKTFVMPNGEVKSDIAAIQKLKKISVPEFNSKRERILKQVQDNPVKENPGGKNSRHAELDSASVDASKFGISFHDRAHRIEHSIELPLLFLNYIWNHDFEIIPILVGNLDELLYSKNSLKEQKLGSFSSLLREQFKNDKETFFLISGDLSHFGHKFGDEQAASTMFEEVKINDECFLETGASGSPERLISLMKEEYDPYRVCGFPPLLTYLKTFPKHSGKILSYDLWDEREQESAVSFGSILYQ